MKQQVTSLSRDVVVSPAPMSLSAARLRDGDPAHVRYIKLGKAGSWVQQSIAQGTIPLRFRNVPQDPCASGDWSAVKTLLAGIGDRSASDTIRELKAFYELDGCLWITIAEGHLWWAFGAGEVVPTDEPDPDHPMRYRRTLDGWHCLDLAGKPLELHRLSSALTGTASYQRTICEVKALPYLLRKLRGEDLPAVRDIRQAQSGLAQMAMSLIALLHERDFEILVDLILAHGGWQRLTAVGAGEVDLDMLLVNRTIGEQAWVQVKSRANQAVLDDYLQRYRRAGIAERFYFVCHSPQGKLHIPDERGLHLWSAQELARKALSAGLLDWIVDRTS